jgi:nitrate/nitrite transporter NarK
MPTASRPALSAFAAFTAALLINQYYRTAMALMAPMLADEMRLTADLLGLLAATYFLSFAAMQLPVGMLLDRFGPRRTAASLMGIAIAGCAIFASATGYPALLLGQALIGVGTAAGFTGGIVICARWFAPQRAATMTGLMLGLGNLGGILAATPLALALDAWGWRATSLMLAAALALIALFILAAARDAPPGHPARSREAETMRQILAGLGQVLRTAEVWRLMALAFVGFASVMAVRGLWGGPYLLQVHALDPVAAGNILLAMSIGVIAGAIGYGLLEQPFDRRRGLALTGGAILCATFAVMALWPHPPLWLVVACFMAIGACGQTYVMVLSHGRANFADRLVGRAVTSLNMAAFLGTATLQAMSGAIMRAFQLPDGLIPEHGYRWLYGFLALVVLLALAIYATSTEARPSEDATRPRIG